MPYSYESTPKKWQEDDNGFLRNTIRFNRVGTMEYLGDELGPLRPENVMPDDVLNIMVHPDTLFDPESMRSLEGMPVVAFEHEWAGPYENYRQVGSVAGSPRQNGPYLEGDIVITDPATIAAIKDGSLSDISSGYNALYEIENGEYDGNLFDGCQRQIRYNHVCLLPANQGRAGTDVRILNSAKQEADMPNDLIKVQLPGSGESVMVAEGDSDKLISAFSRVQNAKPDSIQVNNEMMSAGDIEAKIAENTALQEQVTALNAQIEANNAELASVKEQLEAAMSPAVVEEAAAAMVEEQNEAEEILAQNACPTANAKADIKGLTGHELKKHVVAAVRTANSLPELTEEDLANEGVVAGYFKSYKERPVVAAQNKTVVGAEVMNKAAPAERSVSNRLGYASQEGK